MIKRCTASLVFLLTLAPFQAGAMSCTELDQFLKGIAVARTVNPNITPSRMKQILREDANYSAAEKALLSKYIERSFTKADPAEGAFVPVEAQDCE